MISFPKRAFAGWGAVLTLTAAGHAAEPPIIAKARAYLGTEAALNAVRSIHYSGTLVLTSSNDPAGAARAAIDIIFQKPDQQRISSTSDKLLEVTALDDYDGWQRQTDPKDPTKWQQTLLGVEQIKRLRANTWENLAFFRGLEARGGRIEDRGPATFEGFDCVKVAFIHEPNIIFYRYFDRATGRLVYTETEAGGSIRESGEIRVEGVHFPRTIITTTRTAAGVTQTVTITFDKITLNEVFPASLFSPPVLLAK